MTMAAHVKFLRSLELFFSSNRGQQVRAQPRIWQVANDASAYGAPSGKSTHTARQYFERLHMHALSVSEHAFARLPRTSM